MHAEREDRAYREHETVEIDRDLIGIEDRDKRDGRQAANERGCEQFKCNGSTGAGAAMALGEMAMAMRTGRQRGGIVWGKGKKVKSKSF